MILFFRIFFFSFRDIIDSCYCLGIFFFFLSEKLKEGKERSVPSGY